ncbi:MAG: ComEC/Rec2 family competence protein [Campylobacterota bacterium]|nr:ComEC/Rec2 family competence protein [Campylobacterota bacterium]
MTLERPPLFTKKRDVLTFLTFALLIFSLSIIHKYHAYQTLTTFDDAIIKVHVINQYLKTTKKKEYFVLKVRSENSTFYTTTSKHARDLTGRDIELKVWVSKLTFFKFIEGYYLYSHITKVYPERDAKSTLAHHISTQHHSQISAELFAALYTASPMSRELRERLSALGTSHLLAISGFHLGILSAVLYFLFKLPYSLLQQRYFPYRSSNLDLFVIVMLFLTTYLYFLGAIPSLMRAFVMLLIGFILYDRGIKVISMQTLFLTCILLLAAVPTLLYNIGFWLSICGVFYIFLYLIHFQSNSYVWTLVSLSSWVYLMMLPISLYLFETFSIYHPLSILASILFLPFYLLSIFLHVISQGGILDGFVEYYLSLAQSPKTISLPLYVIVTQLIVSLIAIKSKKLSLALLLFCLFVLMSSIHHVAEF